MKPQYEDDILLVRINGKLRELHKKVKFDCRLEFFTGRDQPGIQTYHRSATFLMLKAFYDVVGAEKIEKVTVDFSLGKGYYIEPHGSFALTEELIDRVKARMHEYVEEKIPIMKRSENTDDAIELFHRHRMYDNGCSATAAFPASTSTASAVLKITTTATWCRIPAISSILIWFYTTTASC